MGTVNIVYLIRVQTTASQTEEYKCRVYTESEYFNMITIPWLWSVHQIKSQPFHLNSRRSCGCSPQLGKYYLKLATEEDEEVNNQLAVEWLVQSAKLGRKDASKYLQRCWIQRKGACLCHTACLGVDNVKTEITKMRIPYIIIVHMSSVSCQTAMDSNDGTHSVQCVCVCKHLKHCSEALRRGWPNLRKK